MIELKHQEGLQFLSDIPDESVDLILTDPPYITSRDSGMDKWVNHVAKQDTSGSVNVMTEEDCNSYKTEEQWNECSNPANDNSNCPELCGDVCWDKTDSKFSMWMDGYFENPLSGQASFDLRYAISDKCAWGIGDAEIYITLPVGVEIINFEPNNILHGADYHFEKAFADGLYPGRWKLEIYHPHGGDLDFGDNEDNN